MTNLDKILKEEQPMTILRTLISEMIEVYLEEGAVYGKDYENNKNDVSKSIKQSVGKYLVSNKGLQKSSLGMKSHRKDGNKISHELGDGTLVTHHLNNHGGIHTIEVRKDGDYHEVEHGDPKVSGKAYLGKTEDILHQTGELMKKVGHKPSPYSVWD